MDFAQAAQTKPDYLKLNPKGRVPALVLENGQVLTETGALLEYIAQVSARTDLVPDKIEDAALMRAVMYYLASTMHVIHAHKARGYRWAANPDSWEDMRIKVSETMTASCAYVESECIAGPFVLGQTYSLADPYLFVVTSWAAGDGVDMEQFPRINAFQSAMNTRASVWAARDKGIIS